MANQAIAEMLELFGQEQACYTSLLDLSRRQKAVIESGDTTALIRLLGQKQQVLGNVTRIEGELGVYKQDWPAFRETLDDNDRQVLDLALATVGELLAELIELEKDSELLLTRRREKSLDDLVNSSRRAAVRNSYLRRGESYSCFPDVASD